MAVARIVGTMYPVAVQLPRLQVGNINVVHVMRAFFHGNGCALGRSHAFVEQAEFDSGCIFCIKGEINTLAIPGGTEWIRDTWIRCRFQVGTGLCSVKENKRAPPPLRTRGIAAAGEQHKSVIKFRIFGAGYRISVKWLWLLPSK